MDHANITRVSNYNSFSSTCARHGTTVAARPPLSNSRVPFLLSLQIHSVHQVRHTYIIMANPWPTYGVVTIDKHFVKDTHTHIKDNKIPILTKRLTSTSDLLFVLIDRTSYSIEQRQDLPEIRRYFRLRQRRVFQTSLFSVLVNLFVHHLYHTKHNYTILKSFISF